MRSRQRTERRAALLILLALLPALAMGGNPLPPLDLKAAKEAVDAATEAGCTDATVGIWYFPEDGVDVVILPKDGDCRSFAMTVADSDVPALRPGQELATLESTAEPRVYRMTFPASDVRRILKGTRCTARVSADGEGIAVKSTGINLRFNPLGMLTGFTRLLRLSVDVPLESAPEGLLKMYPAYDGAGGSKRRPTIL